MTIFALIIIILLVITLAWWQRDTLYPKLEFAPFLYGDVGIDVSHHQGEINWEAVKASDVKFAYMKATEGRDFVDKRFATNWKEARSAKLPAAAYHFFSQCRPGAEQAAHFITVVPKEENQILPHMVDAEQSGTCSYGQEVDDLAREIKTFMDALESHYGHRPIIYTTRKFHDAQLEGKLTNETFWLRSLMFPPRYRTNDWAIWQYHNQGKRPGITGPVDLNVVRGSLRDVLVTPGNSN